VPHFGPESAITVDDFKRGIKEIGLWSSSCMVAFEGDEPIGVLIAAKRDRDANYVHRLAVKPGWERQGHGRHLLTSLVDKAAILGPPRVVAEIAAEWSTINAFFAKSGFVEERRYGDFVRDAGATAGIAADDPRAALVVSLSLDELLESGALAAPSARAWRRTEASLRARAGTLTVLAVATDRIEAHLVTAPSADGSVEVLAIGAEPGPQGAALLGLLLGRASETEAALRIPGIADEETCFDTLWALGFRREREVIGYVAGRAGSA
jgi:ribosomal protein S18 acetylase RimI-like enzyme